ncbi:RNA polymerase II-associated protein 1 [Metarhizium album ARSEF 1941]|uniref:RNA polymerase II-associated protein 1 n=1 Tax=Metarhizium album (strain ARSEF 1941) TaxID=1081103 RepID=A0A0B2WXP0_METAS|nr:RNA polymerase II-associated protein 1 [Metarhizium album ARSEF 1941]KHO01057.1 RNA polymerase II-associated protein 1 [Metarhizium album ARSEF 1941]
MNPTLLIGDIVERDSKQNIPIAIPAAPSSSTGFPSHKRRWNHSAFKRQRAGDLGDKAPVFESNRGNGTQGIPAQSDNASQVLDLAEKQRIDRENRQKLAAMTPQEIAQAQQDIMTGLNPALIQRLLQRANIDEPSGPSPFDLPNDVANTATQAETPWSDPRATEVSDHAKPNSEQPLAERPKPTPGSHGQDSAGLCSKKIAHDYDEDKAPSQIPADLFPITDLPKTTHFPVPPSLPDLDPFDPNFLATLHEKYFPELPADPSKLAWMAPLPSEGSSADKDSTYYPHPEISLSSLRFDFRGRFLSPRVSRSIAPTKGLHHHGEAPEAAGYTIAELARLARSAVPAQRCMAYQTLGRILYRLGKGEWGKTDNDVIAMGIWAAVKKGRVLESLMEAAAGEGGHRGSRAYATEALWLFERGGWKEKFKGR